MLLPILHEPKSRRRPLPRHRRGGPTSHTNIITLPHATNTACGFLLGLRPVPSANDPRQKGPADTKGRDLTARAGGWTWGRTSRGSTRLSMVCQTGGAARGRRFGLDGRLGRGSGLFAWHPVPSPTLTPVRVAIRFDYYKQYFTHLSY